MSSTQPNIVFCFADQLRVQSLGYAGNTDVITPNIDRLAGESVNFVNAVSGHPVCCPYRASLLTGQYCLSHGVVINDVPLGNHARSIAHAYAADGYDTAYIGKWHIYGSPDGEYGRRRAWIPKENRQGFEYWKAFECNHNYMKSPYFEGDSQEEKWWDGYDAVAQTADACRYIRQHAEDEAPFFLMLSWGTPHDPYQCMPEDYLSIFADRPIELRPNTPENQREKATNSLRGYYSHIKALDDCVGLLSQTLDQAGIADNTIFVFTSDHGDMHGSQGLRAKHCPWDESIRVPFLLRWPHAGVRELQSPIDAPDIMPTLLGLCDIDHPDTVEGIDFSPQILAETEDEDAAAFLNFPANYGANLHQGLPVYRGLRTRRYTYTRTPDGPWLLYDNEADTYQMNNLIGKPEFAQLQAELDARLNARLQERADEFLTSEEYIERFNFSHYREAAGEAGTYVNPWS